MNAPIVKPQLSDVLNIALRNLMLNFNCHHVGTIQSFDPATQTATASVNYKKSLIVYDPASQSNVEKLVDYPPIGDAPVFFAGGGQATLTFPVSQGDECMIFFNDRDMDNWFSGGVGQAPATGRLHSFADSVIVVGWRSLGNVILNFDNTRALLQWENGGILGVSSSLVKIANATYTLKGVLTDLVNAIEAITVTTSGGPSTLPLLNQAAFETIKTKIAGLLE
jgi:hypothetical protein